MSDDPHFHVTSSQNRASILEHGLDWTRMAAARGIAGSTRPEQAGCFVSRDEYEVEWFVAMNNTGGPVDVWTVFGVDASELLESPEGYSFVPRVVPPGDVELLRRDIVPRPRPEASSSEARADDGPTVDDGRGLFFEL